MAVAGDKPGRKWGTTELNRGYVVALAGQFQGFCRDLHSECGQAVVAGAPPNLQSLLAAELTRDRQLDRGNARAGALGADFGRFDLDFWPTLKTSDGGLEERQKKLEELMVWRNSVAHDAPQMSPSDIATIRGTTPSRAQNSVWQTNLNVLATAFDSVMRTEIKKLVGTAPW
ncbi:MAG: hypothetical protein REI11_00285 [Patulibacter sp.]|nr:hypothetical protein [Patulibacter sp.]